MRPLYEALMKTPKGATFARDVYSRARPGYHPITATSIDAARDAPTEELIEELRMAQISEWLKLMVAEINRKREDAERAREEDKKRQGGNASRTRTRRLVSRASDRS